MNTTTENTVMPLTNAVIRKTKSEAKPHALTDEQGLYLPVNRAPGYFLWDCRLAGLETMGRSKERE